MCKNRQGKAEWILLPTTKTALYSDGRYAGCINVTLNKALTLPWSTGCGTKRLAQWIDLLSTRYIPQEQRCFVLVSSVATWSLPLLASGSDQLAETLREVQQLAHLRAVAVANWTSVQVSARQSLSDKSNKGVINQISTMSQNAHPRTVVALAIALVALAVAIVSFVLVNPMLRLFWAAMTDVLFCGPLRCTYTDHIEDAANQVKLVSALIEKH